MKKLIFFLLVLVNLASCVGFHDEPDVWVLSEGLWVIPLLLFFGAALFFVLAWLASESNSATDNQNGTVSDNTGNVPVYKLAKFWYGVFLLICGIAFLIYTHSPLHR